MSGILIPCPKCGSGLKLKDRTNLGKLGKCPKCSHRFVLREPDEVELELVDPVTPNTGTSAQWVPDSAQAAQPGFFPQQERVAVAEPTDRNDFAINIVTEPATGTGIRVATHPTISEGMTLAEVTKLLGKPIKRKRMSEMAATARKQGKTFETPADATQKEYMVFQHAAGAYKLIFHNDQVSEIHSQPDPESGAKLVPVVPSKSRRAQKNKWIGIGLGGVLVQRLVGILIFANQVEPPPTVQSAPQKKEAPTVNLTAVADQSQLEGNVEFAQKYTKEHLPTEGKLITFERIPPGANIIIHLRPAEIWGDERKFAEFRATLTSEFVTEWLEPTIRQHCLFEPKEIDEALICLLLGGRGEAPEVAARVKLTAAKKPSEFLDLFGGVANADHANVRLYVNEQRAILVENDLQTFAIAPARMADELVYAQANARVDAGIESIAAHTDKDRHVTIIFQPFDVRVHQEFLVGEKVRPMLNRFLDWLNVDDVDTVAWSMHLGDRQFYSRFLMRPASQVNTQWTPRLLEKSLQKKLKTLPKDLYTAIQMMAPQQLGVRKIIGRFPAMMQVFALSTLGGTGDGMAQFTTILPAKAAPNLALGTLLAWDESTRTDFTKEPPKTQSNEPKLPDLIVDRLKLPMDVDFRRRPLQEAFKDIAEATYVEFEIDGDALKFAGYTQNMPQTFQLGEVPATQAITRILSQYDKMCLCITDEEKNKVTVMTLDVAKQKNLTPLKF